MKIKADFITNSSSTAFVLIGANISDIEHDDMYDIANENNLYYFGEEQVLGKVLARIDYEDYGGMMADMDLAKIQTSFEDVEKLFKKLGIKKDVRFIVDIFTT